MERVREREQIVGKGLINKNHYVAIELSEKLLFGDFILEMPLDENRKIVRRSPKHINVFCSLF